MDKETIKKVLEMVDKMSVYDEENGGEDNHYLDHYDFTKWLASLL